LRIEVDAVFRVSEAFIQIGGDTLDASTLGERFEFGAVATDQNWVGPDGVVADFEAALFANRLNRANEVLVGAHASSDAVHDDAYAVLCHGGFLLKLGCVGNVSLDCGLVSGDMKSQPEKSVGLRRLIVAVMVSKIGNEQETAESFLGEMD
jgi:hypothetical protein